MSTNTSLVLINVIKTFLDQAPKEASQLTTDQNITVSKLHKKVIALFTPKKILDLSDQFRRGKKILENPSSNPLTILQIAPEITLIAITLQTFSKKQELSSLDFLQRVQQGSSALWEPCAQTSQLSEIDQMRGKIKQTLLNHSSETEAEALLDEVTEYINTKHLQTYLHHQNFNLLKMEAQRPYVSTNDANLLSLSNNKILEKMESCAINYDLGMELLAYSEHDAIIKELEEKRNALNALCSYITPQETNSSILALTGAELYLDHLADLEREESEQAKFDNEVMAMRMMEII